MQNFLCIAILPAALLLRYVYVKDKLEKEPMKLLLKLLAFGALCAIPAAFLEGIGSGILAGMRLRSRFIYLFLYTFPIIALAEEGCKYLALRLGSWKNPNFNCRYDGLVYSVFVSLGFAILENILYIAENGLGVGIMRAFTAIPGHCFFAVFTGWGYGMARKCSFEGDKSGAASYTLRGLGLAIAAHGAYDFLAMLGGGLPLILFLALLVGLYVIGFKMINAISAADNYIAPAPITPVFNGDVYTQPVYQQPVISQDAAPRGHFCSQCGAANSADSKFCTVCGNKLN